MSRFRVLFVLLVFAFTGVLQGCVNLRPETYKTPTKDDLDKAGAATYTGPPTGTLQDYVTFTDNLAAWHDQQAASLRQTQALAEEFGFASTVVAAAAGAMNHLHDARVAGGLAAGSTILTDRYKLKVQATDYELAAQAFLCMRDKLADAREVERAAQRSAEDFSLFAILPEVRQQVRDSALSVQRKLQAKLRSIEVATPDLTKLKDALAKKDNFTAGGNLSSLAANVFTGVASSAPITDLRGNILACEAAFN